MLLKTVSPKGALAEKADTVSAPSRCILGYFVWAATGPSPAHVKPLEEEKRKKKKI